MADHGREYEKVDLSGNEVTGQNAAKEDDMIGIL